jgi:flagellar hook-basal body complex protein FliE
MSISGISGITTGIPALSRTDTVGGADAAGGTGGTGGAGQGFAGALDRLQETHDKADNLSVQAATGDLSDAHDYMIAATEASLATEMTVAVRNRAVEAFTSIMQMQI